MANKNKNKLVDQSDDDPTSEIEVPEGLEHCAEKRQPEIEVDEPTFDIHELGPKIRGRTRSELESALMEQASRADSLSFDLEQLRGRHRGLEAELQAREEIAEQMLADAKKSRQEANDAQNALAAVEEETRNAQVQADKSQKQSEHLKDKVDGLQIATKDLKRKVKTLESDLKVATGKAASFDRELRKQRKLADAPKQSRKADVRHIASLTKELETSRGEMSELQSYVNGRKKSWDKLNTDLNQARDQIAAKNLELVRITQDVDEANEQLVRSRERYAKATSQLAEQKEAWNSLNAELSQARDQIAAKDLDISKVSQRVDHKNTLLAESHDKYVAATNELALERESREKIDAELNLLTDQIAAKNQEIARISGDIDERNTQLAASREQFDDATDKLAQEKALQDKLNLELDQAREQIAAKNLEISRISKDIDERNTQLAESREQYDDAMQKLAQEKKSWDKLNVELDQAREQIAAKTREIAGITEDLNARDAQLAEGQEQYDAAMAQLALEKECISELNVELDQAREQIEENNQEISRISEDVDERNTQLVRSREQYISASEQLTQAKAKIRKLNQRADDLERALHQDAAAEIAAYQLQIAEQAGALSAQGQKLERLAGDYSRIEQYSDGLRIQLQDQLTISNVAVAMRQKLESGQEAADESIDSLTQALELEKKLNSDLIARIESMQVEFEKEVRQVRFELDTARETIAGSDSVNQQLASDLVDNQGYRVALEAQLSEVETQNEKTIHRLTQELKHAKKECEDFDRKIGIKDSAIADLIKELSTHTSNIELQSELDDSALQKIDGFRSLADQPDDDENRDRVARLLIGNVDGRALRFPLFKDRLTIGRTSSNDIQLNMQYVSRRHAVISTENGQTRVIDWGSKNGVYVNQEQVAEKVLSSGDTVSIGMADFKYEERSKR